MKRKELGRYHLQAASVGNSTLSCHRRSNNGEKLIHFFFLEEGTVHPHEESLLLDKDPQSGELNRVLKKEGNQKPTYLQRLSFGYAEIGSLRRRRWENDHTRSPIKEHLRGLPYEEDGRLKLSATKIDAFAKCPYTYLASYLYKIEPFDYRETLINNKAIGVLLHDAYERFFSRSGPSTAGRSNPIRSVFKQRSTMRFEDIRNSRPLPLRSVSGSSMLLPSTDSFHFERGTALF